MSALTKMFIVLQLVFSLVCAVLLVLMVSKTENYKSTADGYKVSNFALAATNDSQKAAIAAAQAETTKFQSQFNDANNKLTAVKTELLTAKADLEGQLAKANGQLAAANNSNAIKDTTIAKSAEIIKATNDELTTLRPKVASLTKENADLTRAKNEADNQLQRAERDIKEYQVMLAQGGGTAGAMAPVGSDNQIQTISAAPAAGKINARISDLSLTQGRTLIEMPLGTRDGIAVGTKMYVYRANGYVGDATVQRVSPEQSVAVIDSTKPGESVKVGDLVSTVSK